LFFLRCYRNPNEGLPVAGADSAGSTNGTTGNAVPTAIGSLASQASATRLSALNNLAVLNDVAASLVLANGNDSGPNAKKPKK
jgi:hypothetical protein